MELEWEEFLTSDGDPIRYEAKLGRSVLVASFVDYYDREDPEAGEVWEAYVLIGGSMADTRYFGEFGGPSQAMSECERRAPILELLGGIEEE